MNKLCPDSSATAIELHWLEGLLSYSIQQGFFSSYFTVSDYSSHLDGRPEQPLIIKDQLPV